MHRNTANAIQRARIGSGLTQEKLAERIGYDSGTVRAWECGARIASLEALAKLQAVLDAPWLTGVYMQEQTSAMNGLLPEFEVGRPIAQAAASYINCVLDLVDHRVERKLLRLVADGKIDEVEQSAFDEILALAEATTRAYYEMKFAEGGHDQ